MGSACTSSPSWRWRGRRHQPPARSQKKKWSCGYGLQILSGPSRDILKLGGVSLVEKRKRKKHWSKMARWTEIWLKTRVIPTLNCSGHRSLGPFLGTHTLPAIFLARSHAFNSENSPFQTNRYYPNLHVTVDSNYTAVFDHLRFCLLYTSPSPRDRG